MILYGKIVSAAIGKWPVPAQASPAIPAAGEPGGLAEGRRDPFPRTVPHLPSFVYSGSGLSWRGPAREFKAGLN